MAILAPPDYPTILTNKDWQKKKGMLAKLVGTTGVGAQMDAVENKFKAVDWSKFYARMVCAKEKGVVASIHVDEKVKEMKSEYQKSVEALRKEIIKLESVAKKTAEMFKKKTGVPKSSTKHAEDVVKAASLFLTAMKSNSVYFAQVEKEFGEEKARIQRLEDIAAKAVLREIDNIIKYAKELKTNPTVEQYIGGAKTGFHQSIRGVGAALLNLSGDKKLEAFKDKVWRPLTLDSFKPKEDNEVLPKMAQVVKAVQVLKPLLPK